LLGNVEAKKKNPLQPYFAREISQQVKEPSGASYCNSTNSLWVICDKPSCHYIYELSLEGDLIHEWEFDNDNHDDSEAVACDDTNQLIYMAEEGYMRITSFILPRINQTDTYTTSKKGNLWLIEVSHFEVNLDGIREEPDEEDEDPPGLEGLTWIPTTNSFVVANEKNPPLVITVSLEGEIEHVEYVQYPDDVSGLAYDSELDLLWVLSDQSERVFLTDLQGSEVYDYWDLPMENPEGIAINNQIDPPAMYIVTDPSSPHGKQYISALFIFTKPRVGTGRQFYNKNDPPPPSVECDGCDTVWEIVEEMSSAFISTYVEEEPSGVNVETAVLSSILPVIAITLVVVVAVLILVFYRRRYGPLTKRRKLSAATLTSLDDDEDIFDDEPTLATPEPTGFLGFVKKYLPVSGEEHEPKEIESI